MFCHKIIFCRWTLFSIFIALDVLGLTQSDEKQKTFHAVKLEHNATLPCPVLQEVVEKGELFKFVTWSICTSKVSCDGEEPLWKYIAGMNAHGGTESKQKGIYMLQDGSLRITKVQMKDVTTYQCKVTPPNGTDPTDHNITLFLKEQDFPATNQTKKQTRTTTNPKATKASEGIPGYVYGMVGIIVILVFLLAAAVVYIRHQKRMLNARSNA
ncbi:hypothetical protein ABFA07_018245 [Porites harrisoni]